MSQTIKNAFGSFQVNFGPEFQNKVALSPSRIDTLEHCSQKYYANYFLRLPDKGNSGSSRGSTVHDIMEYLAQKENLGLREEMRKLPSLINSEIWGKTIDLAKKYEVADSENLDLIDQFLVTALKYDTPPEHTKKESAEVPFDFEVIGDGLNFRVRGKMDKVYEVGASGKKKALYVVYRDYKSSKKRFDKKKLATNMQGGIYQFAISLLYLKLELRSFEFLFVKFGNDPIQEFQLYSKEEMLGFLSHLTHLQEKINTFSEKDVKSNLGVLKFDTKGLCGPAASGWICPHQLPMHYVVLLDKAGEIVFSAFTEEEMEGKLKEEQKGMRVEKRFYPGCIQFFSSTGVRK